VWGFAESIVSRIGALMWTAPDPTRGMTIVVDTPANDDPPSYAFARVERNGVTDPRSNILSLTEKIDTRPAPTFVKVYTGSERGDKVSARQVATTTNTALTTARITRGFVVASPPPQPRHMRSTRAKTIARAAKEGERVVLDAMRDFRTVRLTVRGHGQVVNGVPTLYGINTVARVYDSVCTDARGNALDEAMLITQVTFRRSRSAGTTTELMLVPLGALKMEPEGV
jgi:prophage tail gpP-like protein